MIMKLQHIIISVRVIINSG